MDFRVTTQGPEVLVKWRDLPEFEASWVSTTQFQLQFPYSHLRDKVSSLEGSIVGHPELRKT